MLRINDVVPDFAARTTHGDLRLHEWMGDGWTVLFSHPKDFTPVCTTELGAVAALAPEFERRRCRVLGLSVDPVESHERWKADIAATQGHMPEFPMIGDEDLAVAKLLGMLPAEAQPGVRTAADNQTVRHVLIIGPDRKVKAMMTYPMTTGRNFAEVLRVLDSLQLMATHSVATPANWTPGDDVIIPGSVSDEAARAKYPEGFRTLTPYLRMVAQPGVQRTTAS
jgi:alkyl hydroperoxide reductase subunit AhpC